METLRVLVQNLIILVILAILLEMLLPGGEMRRYIKMVLGLMVIVAVIQGINGLSGGGLFKEVEEYAWRQGSEDKGKLDILQKGKLLDEENKRRAMEQYRSGLEKQVAGLAGLDGKIKLSGAVVKIQDDPAKGDYGKIKEINLLFSKNSSGGGVVSPVEPVSVNTGSNEAGGQAGEKPPPEYLDAARKAAEKIAGFYNLSPDEVKTVFQ